MPLATSIAPLAPPAAKAGAGQGRSTAQDHRHHQRHDRQFQRGRKPSQHKVEHGLGAW
jgi:hypothetical protein